ncbi:N-acetylmuramoyl-L-alanine amidase [Paucisalibacillus globulus]|uniref:N-acetylmuramoyl-L-alanine amidase n=1 Tax=Paucisalibacillus globulus TaxID=351095 RepID=UPI000BB78D79|nr:N-acetylmuramoyl-L-alanine amidase [Paucisalibacillus globulus]
MKLYLDPGHGGTDNGASGNGLLEKNITLDIALRIRNTLINGFDNVDIMMSRSSDITKTLKQRTDEANAWGADYFLSIHCNAFNGSARGYEDYIHSNLSDSSLTARYQDILHTEITKLNQLTNRGQKKENFHVLRESAMPAILTENGFIDNASDANLMKQATWRQAVAQGHANGIAIAFNLPPKQSGGDVLYKVIAGSFTSRANAEERVTFLSNKGIDSYIGTVVLSGTTWYRVQAGAFSSRDNAEQRLQQVKNAGIQDAYIAIEQSTSALEPVMASE